MENQLSQYLGKDLRQAITGLTVVSGTAKNSGSIYYAIEMSFINGYKKRLFLQNDEAFAWANAFQMLETDKQIDAAF